MTNAKTSIRERLILLLIASLVGLALFSPVYVVTRVNQATEAQVAKQNQVLITRIRQTQLENRELLCSIALRTSIDVEDLCP